MLLASAWRGCQALYTQSTAQFGTYVDAGTLLNNYAHVLDLLTRLRQAINHPYLVIHSHRGEEATAAAGGGSRGGLSGVCGLCFEDAEDGVLSACGHVFCRQCMRDYIESLDPNAASQCPTCHQPLSVDLSVAATSSAAAAAFQAARDGADEDAEDAEDGGAAGGSSSAGVTAAGRAKRGILSRINLAHFQSSTKIEALMEELHLMREKDPSAKAIVFSQYVAFLDLLEHRLMVCSSESNAG